MLYISDRNSLFTVSNLHDREAYLKQVASIDHAFVMHKMDARVDFDWMIMEAYTSASGDGRGLYQGHIYDHDSKLVCSFMQDGVLSVADDYDPTKGGGTPSLPGAGLGKNKNNKEKKKENKDSKL